MILQTKYSNEKGSNKMSASQKLKGMPTQLRELGEWFDDPEEVMKVMIDIVPGPATAGYLLRAIANKLEDNMRRESRAVNVDVLKTPNS